MLPNQIVGQIVNHSDNFWNGSASLKNSIQKDGYYPTYGELPLENAIIQPAALDGSYSKLDRIYFVNKHPTSSLLTDWSDVGYFNIVNGEIEYQNPLLVDLRLGRLFNIPYMVTNSFNEPRSYGNNLHEGTDFDVLTRDLNSKEPVLSMQTGVVNLVSYYESGYGNYLEITHYSPNGGIYKLLYAHLDEIFVEKGDYIYKGTPIGEIGTTGRTTGEHVHVNLSATNYGLQGYVWRDVVDLMEHYSIPEGY